jgi:hypothetical protein
VNEEEAKVVLEVSKERLASLTSQVLDAEADLALARQAYRDACLAADAALPDVGVQLWDSRRSGTLHKLVRFTEKKIWIRRPGDRKTLLTFRFKPQYAHWERGDDFPSYISDDEVRAAIAKLPKEENHE